MAKKRKIASVLIALAVLVTMACPTVTQAASASKAKSMTVTLNEGNSYEMLEYVLKKKTKLKVTIKVLQAKGKAKEKKIYWPAYESDTSKGSLFYDLKTKKLKKGATFTSKELIESPTKSGFIDFYLPEGMKSLKVKITISATNGKKVVKSFKRCQL